MNFINIIVSLYIAPYHALLQAVTQTNDRILTREIPKFETLCEYKY